MARKKIGYRWHLRRLMADRDMYATTDLRPLLADRGVVLARIIEPTSWSTRVLAETVWTRCKLWLHCATSSTATRRSCAVQAALGPTSLVLYDVSTLYFETDKADGFREPGYSKERRLEPQITIGLLTDATVRGHVKVPAGGREKSPRPCRG